MQEEVENKEHWPCFYLFLLFPWKVIIYLKFGCSHHENCVGSAKRVLCAGEEHWEVKQNQPEWKRSCGMIVLSSERNTAQIFWKLTDDETTVQRSDTRARNQIPDAILVDQIGYKPPAFAPKNTEYTATHTKWQCSSDYRAGHRVNRRRCWWRTSDC